MFLRVFHLTTDKNLPSIMERGVLSRAKAAEEGFEDIADHHALNNHVDLKIGKYFVNQYARFFFNPLPPMYYKRKNEGYKGLCIVELSIPFKKVQNNIGGIVFHRLFIQGVNSDSGVYIMNMSISSLSKKDHDYNISKHCVNNLSCIEWDAFRDAYNADRDLTIAKRGAELLVYPMIPAKYITAVYSDSDITYAKPVEKLEHWSKQGKVVTENGSISLPSKLR